MSADVQNSAPDKEAHGHFGGREEWLLQQRYDVLQTIDDASDSLLDKSRWLATFSFGAVIFIAGRLLSPGTVVASPIALLLGVATLGLSASAYLALVAAYGRWEWWPVEDPEWWRDHAYVMTDTAWRALQFRAVETAIARSKEQHQKIRKTWKAQVIAICVVLLCLIFAIALSLCSSVRT